MLKLKNYFYYDYYIKDCINNDYDYCEAHSRAPMRSVCTLYLQTMVAQKACAMLSAIVLDRLENVLVTEEKRFAPHAPVAGHKNAEKLRE